MSIIYLTKSFLISIHSTDVDIWTLDMNRTYNDFEIIAVTSSLVPGYSGDRIQVVVAYKKRT